MSPHGAWLPLLLLLGLPLAAQTTFRVDDYGAAGDGVTDDAPAIQRAIAAAAGHPAVVQFTAGRTYRLLSPHPGEAQTAGRPGISVISLEGVEDLTIDGQGARLLIHPDVQFCFARDCRNLTVRGFEVDCAPQPFVPSTIEAVDNVAHTIDVRIEDGYDVPVADGTEQPRHPPFFGWIVPVDDIGNIGHYFIDKLTKPGDDPRVVRLHALENTYAKFEGMGVVVGSKFSVPVPGMAHVDRRFMQIYECENVTVADLKIWTVPYFAFNFGRNTGFVKVSDVTLTPQPGTLRLTSAGRDGFHCKGNRAQMTFERCTLAGLRDDCFNISAMTAVPQERVSDTELIVKRAWYPNLDWAEFAAGDLVALYDEVQKTIFWCERVESAEEVEQGNLKLTRLTFGERPNGVEPEPLRKLPEKVVVYNQDIASPGAIIRHCSITGSCRMRSRLLIDESTFEGFNWYYADHIEGPFPRQVMIRNSHFINRDVRNNRGDCLLFALPNITRSLEFMYGHDDIVLQHNVFDGAVVFDRAQGVTLIGNQFNVVHRFKPPDEYDAMTLDNTLGGQTWSLGEAQPASNRPVSLIWPLACFVGRLPGDTENRHVAALGPEVVARRSWGPIRQGGTPTPVFHYALHPPQGGEVGIELDLDAEYVTLGLSTDLGNATDQGCVVYGCRRDGSRQVLPPAESTRGEGLNVRADLTAVPPEFDGRRRIDVVFKDAAGADYPVRIRRLFAWRAP